MVHGGGHRSRVMNEGGQEMKKEREASGVSVGLIGGCCCCAGLGTPLHHRQLALFLFLRESVYLNFKILFPRQQSLRNLYNLI